MTLFHPAGDLLNPVHPFTYLNALTSSNPFPVFCGHGATYQNCMQISVAYRNGFCLGLFSNGFIREFIIFVTGT